ncbi:hypothetical protein JCM6882_008609 [Rhodosporidiobolus microsporus]
MSTTGLSIELPDVDPGENPFLVFRATIRGILNPTASDGFKARLLVLFALMGYAIVLSFAYLTVMAIDYRRRKKRFWLWRLVTRPNGRYIVGNQHAIFAICTIISSCILIGFTNNTRRVVLLLKYQQRAFFWRTLVWIPMILHAWLSSWANLQAAILSGQKATNQHLLSPRVANIIYIAGIILLLLPILVLDIYSGFSWRRTWEKAILLRNILISRAITDPDMPVEEAAAIAQPPLDVLNGELQFFGKTQRAVSGLYILAMVIIVAVNIGGLGLLFTLRKQIKFNTRRLSGNMRTNTFPGRSTIPVTPPVVPPTLNSAYFPGSPTSPETPHPLSPTTPATPATPHPLSPAPLLGMYPPSSSPPHPLSPDPNSDSPPPPQTLIRKVFFAGAGKGDALEAPDDKMTVSQLKEAASDKTPAGAAQREQAKQLLALKKIEWDLFVFLAAIVILATCFLAIALWLCIAPMSVYKSWAAMEIAYFLVPWMYLAGVCASLTFLFFNAVRHLLSHKHRMTRGRLASVVGLGGRSNRDVELSTGTFTEDLTSETFSRPGAAHRGIGVAVQVERHVTVEMDDDESPRGTRH